MTLSTNNSRSAAAHHQLSEPIPMPTAPKDEVVVDLASLNESELRSLASRDPFLFHSIPSVHRDWPTLKDGAEGLSGYYAPVSQRGLSTSGRDAAGDDDGNDGAAATPTAPPAGTQRAARRSSRRSTAFNSEGSSSFVSRKSRVSTECHASLIMEDLLEDEDFLRSSTSSGFDSSVEDLGLDLDFDLEVEDLMDSLMSLGVEDDDDDAGQGRRSSCKFERRSTYTLG